MSEAILLSGGLDSAALSFWKRPSHAIFVDYGQRAAPAELRAAGAIAGSLGIRFSAINVDVSALGQGSMAGGAQAVLATTPEWWPFRNQLLITLAAMKMAASGESELMIGSVCTDIAHKDGTAEFRDAMNAILAAQEGVFRLTAPASHLSTVQLIQIAAVPLELLAWTHSCHISEYPCGICRGCRKHLEVLAQLGW